MSDILLTIDGKELKAKDGMTVLEVARGAGIKIPTLCFHKELELPVEVDENSAVSTYRNGVLETIIKKRGERGSGRAVKIL